MLPLNVICSYSGNKGHNQMVPICNLMTDPLYVCYSLNTLAGTMSWQKLLGTLSRSYKLSETLSRLYRLSGTLSIVTQ